MRSIKKLFRRFLSRRPEVVTLPAGLPMKGHEAMVAQEVQSTIEFCNVEEIDITAVELFAGAYALAAAEVDPSFDREAWLEAAGCANVVDLTELSD